MAPRKPASLKVRALQWLAQREHSRSELRGKLLRLLRASADHEHIDDADDRAGGAAQEVDTLLDWLASHRYLSDARFVDSRVHARAQRFGNLRIRQELQRHGVDLDAAAQQALKDSEIDRAREVWRKKFGSPAADAAARVRQMRFLTGRGFSSDVIRRVLREAGAAEPASPCGDLPEDSAH